MANDKRLVEAITFMDVDFAQWCTNVAKKAELIDYSSVKGCMVIKSAGCAVWENIQKELDRRSKETGVENVYMPIFIPESPLQKEKDHAGGLVPEVVWVAHGGLEPLQERMRVRSTSETLFYDFYARDIQSHRDLSKLYNQWCSVVRWEKTTRPFPRSRRFLWRGGHTIYATIEEAGEGTEMMLSLYADFCEEALAMSVIRGRKTNKEKFAGAGATYTIEALMRDSKALRSGTSHNFGDGFMKAFDIQYMNKDNTLKYVHRTFRSMTIRLIDAIIMVHGGNNNLALPPRTAPTQVTVVPIQQRKEGVTEKTMELKETLSNFRVKMDDSGKSPGWKLSECGMRGIPLRVEIEPRDIEADQAVLVHHDTHEKITVALEELGFKVGGLLEAIQKEMFERAEARRDAHTYEAVDFETFQETVGEKPRFVKAMWCGCQGCEGKIREPTGATSRYIPFKQEKLTGTYICYGKPATKMVYWGRAY